MENGKQPITPTMYTKCGEGKNDYKPLKDGQKTGWEVKFGGITKREYFAGLAMQALISGNSTHFSDIPEKSVIFADALLLELDKS
jgi:hypothetical protein